MPAASIRRIRIAVATALIFVLVGLTGPMSTAGAQRACGEFSFSFSGTRLINDGISDTAGPFAIELPAGVYDIVLDSHDDHPSTDYQPEQTAEQFYFTLDNGFRSQLSADIPANGETMRTVFEAVPVDGATSITVHHRGVGGVNSVNVVCIGFTTRVLDTPALFQEHPTTTTVAPVVPTVPAAPVPEAPPTLALTGSSRTALFVGIGIALIGLGVAVSLRGDRRPS